MSKNVVVIGSGAIGLLYGGRLLQKEVNRGELNVQFICRSDSQLKKAGFRITSKDSDFDYTGSSKFHQSYRTIDRKESIDWIILTTKSYALDSLDMRNNIKELLNDSTRVLVLMNGYGCEKSIADLIPSNRIFGGIAFVCCNRDRPSSDLEPVMIHHLFNGTLLLGHYLDDPEEVALARDLWRGTAIDQDVITSECLLKSRWSKLCWNIPFSGLSVAFGAVTTDVIASTPSFRHYADQILADTIALANMDITENNALNDKQTTLIDPAVMREYCWSLTDKMGAYKTSSAIDLASGQQLEVEYLFTSVLNRAIHHSQCSATDNPCYRTKFPYLESVIHSVQGVSVLADIKRSQQTVWKTNFFDK